MSHDVARSQHIAQVYHSHRNGVAKCLSHLVCIACRGNQCSLQVLYLCKLFYHRLTQVSQWDFSEYISFFFFTLQPFLVPVFRCFCLDFHDRGRSAIALATECEITCVQSPKLEDGDSRAVRFQAAEEAVAGFEEIERRSHQDRYQYKYSAR